MSNISKGVIISNVPEPPSPSLKFYYNFFVPDERVSTSGKSVNTATLQKGLKELVTKGSNDTPDAISVTKQIPRFVHVRYTTSPEQKNDLSNGGQSASEIPLFQYNEDFANENINIIISDDMIRSAVSEAEHNTLTYGAIQLQDTGIGNRIKSMIDMTLKLRTNPSQHDKKGSVTDYAYALDKVTPSDVHGKKILDALSAMVAEDPLIKSQLNLVNEVKEPIGRDFLSAQAAERLYMTINDSFIFTTVSSAISQPCGPYVRDMIRHVHKELDDLYEDRLKVSNTLDTHLDFQATKVVVAIAPIPDKDLTNPNLLIKGMPWGLVGYIAQKRELLPSGDSKIVQEEVINMSNKDNVNYSKDGILTAGGFDFFDTNVKYGSIYSYSLSAVYGFTSVEVFVNKDGYQDGIYRGLYLIKSRPSAEKRITCDEYIAPNPPNDISFDYEYEKDGLLVSWQLPTAPQADTAKIQVFRRKSVFDPFTCIAEYDFNGSVDLYGNPLPIPSNEFVIPRNRHRIPQNINGQRLVPTLHVDEDFGRGSDFIYAACAIDAHGYTSGYSDQFRVRFNKNINNIEVYRVSRIGAPKQYPNFYIESGYTQQVAKNNPLVSTPFENSAMPDSSPADAFSVTEEAMRDSGHKKMRVYFDPEFLRIDPSVVDGEKLYPPPLLSTVDRNGSYGINIINLDRMKSRSVHFEIKDSIQITDVNKIESTLAQDVQEAAVNYSVDGALEGIHSLDEGDNDPVLQGMGLAPKFNAQ